MSEVLAWIEAHETLLIGIAGLSVAMFIGTLLVVPWMLLRIPEDYFAHKHRPPGVGSRSHIVLRWTLRILKNAFGAVCILAGIAMLVLPGQGLLTILIGLLLIEFPGKYAMERRLIARPRVFRTLNRFRQRRGHEPLAHPFGRA
ncbi:MAG: hypothetical protein LAT64_00740 [Phycisphaerales bacterium]|nr:hypothetical protein [Planctomycetota bacterium]MCH8507288.1 hypothetical protein [Phycisphaerales bacterium]